MGIIFSGFKFGPHSVKDADSSFLTYHRILEAFKAAYLKRIDLGDPSKDASINKVGGRVILRVYQ